MRALARHRVDQEFTAAKPEVAPSANGQLVEGYGRQLGHLTGPLRHHRLEAAVLISRASIAWRLVKKLSERSTKTNQVRNDPGTENLHHVMAGVGDPAGLGVEHNL